MRVTTELKWAAVTGVDGYRVSWGRGVGEFVVTVPKEHLCLTLDLEVERNKLTPVSVQSFDVAGNMSAKKLIGAVFAQG